MTSITNCFTCTGQRFTSPSSVHLFISSETFFHLHVFEVTDKRMRPVCFHSPTALLPLLLFISPQFSVFLSLFDPLPSICLWSTKLASWLTVRQHPKVWDLIFINLMIISCKLSKGVKRDCIIGEPFSRRNCKILHFLKSFFSTEFVYYSKMSRVIFFYKVSSLTGCFLLLNE